MEKKAEKKIIRKAIKELRAGHTEEEIHAMSGKILEHCVSLPEYRDAEVIYAYVDCKREVETRELIRTAWAENKRVAVPKIVGKEMKFFYITSLEEDLEDGFFGIREPREVNPALEEEALMFMPGVAFDEERHRIGYGGGYYDRFLEAHPRFTTVALAFEFQVRKEVPFEVFDILPGKIVTEKRIIEEKI